MLLLRAALLTCDLFTVKHHIDNHLKSQWEEISTAEEKERIYVRPSHRGYLYRKLVRRVSVFALQTVREQVSLPNDGDDSVCSGQFTQVWGIPCKHKLKEYVTAGSLIPLEDIHDQWLLDGPEMPAAEPGTDAVSEIVRSALPSLSAAHTEVVCSQMAGILSQNVLDLHDPRADLVRRKGRPRGSTAAAAAKKRKHTASGARELSAHEYAEKRVSLCGLCKQRGHNKRTCPNK